MLSLQRDKSLHVIRIQSNQEFGNQHFFQKDFIGFYLKSGEIFEGIIQGGVLRCCEISLTGY